MFPISVLITGCSTGFGRLSALTLAAAGHRVFATMRAPTGRDADSANGLLEAACALPGTIEVLALDLRDDASVLQAVHTAISTAGQLDVVVNNAGVGAIGQLEAFSASQLGALLDINVVGAQRVTRAVLPHMRRRRSGLLIQISASLGRMSIPFVGPYAAGKFALEAMSEILAYELAPTGVEVCIVEPGAFGTQFLSSAQSPDDAERVASYGPLADAPTQMRAAMGAALRSGDAPDPQWVADAIAELIATPAGRRPLRTVVDPVDGAGIEAMNRARAEIQAEIHASFHDRGGPE